VKGYATDFCLEKREGRGKLEDIDIDGDDKNAKFCILN
jgi:hypothetical protein